MNPGYRSYWHTRSTTHTHRAKMDTTAAIVSIRFRIRAEKVAAAEEAQQEVLGQDAVYILAITVTSSGI